jgi:hypothetical protein
MSARTHRFEMPAAPTGGRGAPRSVRLVRYPGTGTMSLGIGAPGRRARGVARLTPTEARELAMELEHVAEVIEHEEGA